MDGIGMANEMLQIANEILSTLFIDFLSTPDGIDAMKQVAARIADDIDQSVFDELMKEAQ